MNGAAEDTTMHAQRLLGRRVQDHEAKSLGRVYDLEVEQVGSELCVTALRLGPSSWLARFGWTMEEHGKRVPWEYIETLTPVIRLRAGYADAAR